jgi:hypothetical protein
MARAGSLRGVGNRFRRNERLDASTVAMSGFFAPDRIERPRPDRAMNRRDSNDSFPRLIASSMSVVVMTATSNGSPASILLDLRRRLERDDTLWPVIFFELRESSSTTARTPLCRRP